MHSTTDSNSYHFFLTSWPPFLMTHTKTTIHEIHKKSKGHGTCCSMNFSIHEFCAIGLGWWATIVTNSDRVWLPCSRSRPPCAMLRGSESLQLPVLIWGRAELKHRTFHRSRNPTIKICETQIFLKSSSPIVRIIVTWPARTVGPSNLKSCGFAWSRGRAAQGTCMTVTRTWMRRRK